MGQKKDGEFSLWDRYYTRDSLKMIIRKVKDIRNKKKEEFTMENSKSHCSMGMGALCILMGAGILEISRED